MNNIRAIQNETSQLQRLAAQRQLYADAKTALGVQFILSAPVTVILMTLAIIFPEINVYVALWGILLWLADELLLNKYQKELKEKAATIQEYFDCDVLSIPWNKLKANDNIVDELVKEYSENYNNSKTPMPSIRDWYSISVQNLPVGIARLVCQRANCCWDAKQRRRYANLIRNFLLILLIGMTIIGLIANLTIEDFLLIIAVPLMPAIRLLVRQVSEHNETADRLDKLKSFTESLWSDAINGLDADILLTRSRTLQDEIFEGRKRNAPIFDWMFRKLRRDYEIQMNHSSERLVAEAREKLGL